jgi:surface antigen
MTSFFFPTTRFSHATQASFGRFGRNAPSSRLSGAEYGHERKGSERWGGAAVGGLLGSQVGKGSGKLAATAAGVVLGGWLGNEIGASLDKADRSQMSYATQRAYTAPVGQQITWKQSAKRECGHDYPRAGWLCQ